MTIFILAGYWNPRNKEFYEVGEQSNIWLVDGNNAKFNADGWNQNNNNKSFGFSGRLLKNWNGLIHLFGSVFIIYNQSMLDKDKLLKELFQAYYKARKGKRNTINVARFEVNMESNIFKLYDELISGNYKISQSIYFIIKDPAQREIFAGNFRDRIVHHLIYNHIYDICEREFIYDSYSCRLNKGTHFGIRRVGYFIRSCSQNYVKDCYILKMDISGFFMNINKDILFKQIQYLLSKHRAELEIDSIFLINLIEKVIYDDPTINSIFKGNKLDYEGLPSNKCLSGTQKDKGLPIGNLTSQLFANTYMDKYLK